MNLEERKAAEEAFRGPAQVLVSTDAGAISLPAAVRSSTRRAVEDLLSTNNRSRRPSGSRNASAETSGRLATAPKRVLP